MSDDDDAPALSAETFVALQEFYAEQAKREEIFQKLQAEDKLKENVLFDENWENDDDVADGNPASTDDMEYQYGYDPQGNLSAKNKKRRLSRQRRHLRRSRVRALVRQGYTKEEAAIMCQDPQYNNIIKTKKTEIVQEEQGNRSTDYAVEFDNVDSYPNFERENETVTFPPAKRPKYDSTSNVDVNEEPMIEMRKEHRNKSNTVNYAVEFDNIDSYPNFKREIETDTFPPAKRLKYDSTSNVDVNEETYFQNDPSTAHKEKPKSLGLSGSSRRRLRFWMSNGYTFEKALERCKLPLTAFAEYHEIIARRANTSQADQSNKSHNVEDVEFDNIDSYPNFEKESETDTFPPAKRSKYDSTSNSNVDVNEETYFQNDPSTAHKEKFTGSSRKRLHFWMSNGYMYEEAQEKRKLPLTAFAEFHEIRARRRGNTSQADLSNKSHNVDDRIESTSKLDNKVPIYNSDKDKDPIYVSPMNRFDRRRRRFWLNHGYSRKQATARCQRPLVEFSEYHKIIAREVNDKHDQSNKTHNAETIDHGSYKEKAIGDQKRKRTSGAQKKRFVFWMTHGYTKEEATERSLRPLREFPEYHEINAYTNKNASQAVQSKRSHNANDRIESNRKSHCKSTAEDKVNDRVSPPKSSVHDRTSNSDNKDVNYDSDDDNDQSYQSSKDRLAKKRLLCRKTEEANARCENQLKDFPENKHLGADKTASSTTTNKQNFYDFEESNKTKNDSLQVCIKDDNDYRKYFTLDKRKLLEKEILRYIDSSTSSPNFTSYTFKNGPLILTCKDGDTRDWLFDNIGSFKPWEGAALRVSSYYKDELPPLILAEVKIPDKISPKILLSRLAVQNEELGCERWKIFSVKQEEKLQTICFSIDSTSEAILHKNMCKLFLGLGTITQLSQFWYDETTVNSLVKVIDRVVPNGGRVALISCPTLFVPVKRQIGERASVSLLEYDERFEVHAPDFIYYDYNLPDKLPTDLHHTYDLVIADPPFLAEECITKTSETIKLLAKDKIVVCTGAVMKEHVEKLLGLKLCEFQPHHRNNLANEFSCYANFDLDSLLR